MKVALLMGNRLNTWHTRLYEPLAGLHTQITAFTYRPHRYPLEDVRIPYEIVPTEAEERSLPRRIKEGLETRLVGTEISERPVGLVDRLKDFDLIHTWELFTTDTEDALEAKRRWDIPVLVTVWDNIAFHREELDVFSRRKQRARNEADGFLVYTRTSAEMLQLEGVEEGRIHQVMPGVDTNEFVPSPEPPDLPVLLAIGRLVPEKGFEDLLIAAATIRRKSPDLPFSIRLVGEGPMADRLDHLSVTGKLRNHYRREGGVAYRDLPALLQNSNILVLPSRMTSEWKEQFGMVLLEAMASGVPVVASRSGGIPEIVGYSGLLFTPGDHRELATLVEHLLASKEEWNRLRESGLERCRSLFSAHDNSKKIHDLYGYLSQQRTP